MEVSIQLSHKVEVVKAEHDYLCANILQSPQACSLLLAFAFTIDNQFSKHITYTEEKGLHIDGHTHRQNLPFSSLVWGFTGIVMV